VRRAPESSPRVILAVLSLGGIAYALLQSLVVPALPEIQKALGTSEGAVGWILTAFLLSASVATPIIGRLGDVYGKERLLMVVLLMLALGTLISAVASSLWLMLLGRVIQGAGGGIFPLAFSIIRDEFPNERVPGAIGLVSSLLGIGGGAGVVFAGIISQNLSYHWLFWFPLAAILATAYLTWRYIPESPVKTPAEINYRAAALMTAGISAVLLAITETSTWGWGSPKTIGLFAFGVAFCALWVTVEVRSREPLVDMAMMRIRGVWTTNLAAFLLGAGMYSSFIVLPQFAQLPESTGFGFGASAVESSLYLLPSALTMGALGLAAGRVARRFGSKLALIVGAGVAAVAFAFAALVHDAPIDQLLTAALLGIGIGLAFAALGNLIVQAVPATQTGVASGMNTVMRTLGGALGGQISATFIADNTAHGQPTVTGFTDTYVMATAFLLVCVLAGLLIPRLRAEGEPRQRERRLEPAAEVT
jgi:EmrB/QacA subfamily drug resistance transporter